MNLLYYAIRNCPLAHSLTVRFKFAVEQYIRTQLTEWKLAVTGTVRSTLLFYFS